MKVPAVLALALISLFSVNAYANELEEKEEIVTEVVANEEATQMTVRFACEDSALAAEEEEEATGEATEVAADVVEDAADAVL